MKTAIKLTFYTVWHQLMSLSRRQKLLTGLIFLVLLILSTKTYDTTTYAFFTSAHALPRSQTEDYSIPTFINIPSVEITLPIEEASINHGIWGLSIDGASHLSSSRLPGEKGNIVIYAKNSDEKFGRLTSLQKGDEILIITQDGTTHPYEVTELLIVTPTESGIIDDTKDETLTLYTSFGFGDLKRLVVRAEPTQEVN